MSKTIGNRSSLSITNATSNSKFLSMRRRKKLKNQLKPLISQQVLMFQTQPQLNKLPLSILPIQTPQLDQTMNFLSKIQKKRKNNSQNWLPIRNQVLNKLTHQAKKKVIMILFSLQLLRYHLQFKHSPKLALQFYLKAQFWK